MVGVPLSVGSPQPYAPHWRTLALLQPPCGPAAKPGRQVLHSVESTQFKIILCSANEGDDPNGYSGEFGQASDPIGAPNKSAYSSGSGEFGGSCKSGDSGEFAKVLHVSVLFNACSIMLCN